MTPEEWPLAAPAAADENAPARAAGSDRLATVRADFFLDPRARLSEQERALMTAMLHCLVSDAASEIRALLPGGWTAANDDSNASLADSLATAGLLDQPELVALLLRRADEERIAAGARGRTGRREARVLQGLVSHENGAIAAAAMALILARGKRRDRFGQCLVALDDLGRDTADKLVHAVAAGISRELAADKAPGVADETLAKACRDLLERRDPERSVDALTAALVDLLDDDGALTDELLLSAANEGEIGFLAQALARAAGVDGAVALDELLSANSGRLTLFLRAAGSSRALAAGLLAALGDLLGVGDAGAAIDRFGRISDDAAAAARARLASAPAYRAALSALEKSHGHRSL
jgi:hypothetical protein